VRAARESTRVHSSSIELAIDRVIITSTRTIASRDRSIERAIASSARIRTSIARRRARRRHYDRDSELASVLMRCVMRMHACARRARPRIRARSIDRELKTRAPGPGPCVSAGFK